MLKSIAGTNKQQQSKTIMDLNTLRLRTTVTAAATVYYSAFFCVIAVATATGANNNGAMVGQHIQPYRHFRQQHHHQLAPVTPYLRNLKLSPTDAIYLRGKLQPNHETRYYHHRYQQLPQHQYHHHLEDDYLKESAKNPNNLKNGIYHNGAVTYDLGMPHYEILNPHEHPEIITSDQPNYHQHLKQLEQSQNFTVEDFGATPEPSTPTPATETTSKPTSATLEPVTETQPELETATTAQNTTLATVSPKQLMIKQQNIEEDLPKTKEKLQEIYKQIQVTDDKKSEKSQDNDVKFIVIRKNDNLRKKMKPAPFKVNSPRAELTEDSKRVTETPVVSKKSHDLTNVHKMYATSQREPAISSHDGSVPGSREVFAHVPPHSVFVPQYPAYHPHPAVQYPYSVYNLHDPQTPISTNTLHRLYRSASFLTTSENNVEAPDSTFISTTIP